MHDEESHNAQFGLFEQTSHAPDITVKLLLMQVAQELAVGSQV